MLHAIAGVEALMGSTGHGDCFIFYQSALTSTKQVRDGLRYVEAHFGNIDGFADDAWRTGPSGIFT